MASWSLLSTDSQVYWYYKSDGSLFNATVPRTGTNLWTWHLLRNVTNYGVWKIFGQVETITDIDAYSYVAFVLDIIFIAIANVLLLNVLVALFNVTIRDVEERSKQVWGYERYLIINEYRDKPSIPPPVGTPYILYRSVRHLYRKLQSFLKRSFGNCQ
ncbi:unnamed protein product [Rotaria sp. Silwood1]|nr:unnamed protein product [Rotaria sp. Silwood1]